LPTILVLVTILLVNHSNLKNAMHNESVRLAGNHKALLQTLPDIVLVVTSDGSIEYMNPPAVSFFKAHETRPPGKAVDLQLPEILSLLLCEESTSTPQIHTLNGQTFDCHIAPFAGYKGDSLHWIILRTVLKAEQTPKEPTKDQSEQTTLIGSSAVMHKLKELASQVAVTNATVLITGESGTGKELFAKLIKQRSNRSDKPFLTINCNTISDSLLESDLFGYEKGAFTGAQSMKKGKFEVSDGGTIFLDEIGDISPRMQAVLLRVLQNGEIIRVGGNAPFKVDVRVIAATNRDLATEVREGRFRLDLFYRLSVIKIHIPPLRERKEDLLDLTRHFIKKYCTLFKRDNKLKPKKILAQLNSHHWPGNVRELENVIQRAILMYEDDSLFSSVLAFDTWAEGEQSSKLSSVVREFNGTPLKNIIDHIEKEVILQKLATNGGNVAETAEKLNICKAALYEKLKRHAISIKPLR